MGSPEAVGRGHDLEESSPGCPGSCPFPADLSAHNVAGIRTRQGNGKMSYAEIIGLRERWMSHYASVLPSAAGRVSLIHCVRS